MVQLSTKTFVDLMKKRFNPLINKYFKDVEIADWEADKNNDRKVVKHMCLHRSGDSLIFTVAKMLLLKLYIEGLLEQAIIGFPQSELERMTKFSSQVILHFKETKGDALDNDRMPVWKQIAFRYRGDLTSQADVTALATTINTTFGGTTKFKWNTGEKLYTYKDLEKGYNFQIYALSEPEAKSVIEKVFEVQNDGAPEWDEKLVLHESNKDYTPSGTQTIVGITQKKPRLRPKATVHFAWAELHIVGLRDRIILCDTTYSKPEAIIFG